MTRKLLVLMFVAVVAIAMAACSKNGNSSCINPNAPGCGDSSVQYEAIGTWHNLLKADGSPTIMWMMLTAEPIPPRGFQNLPLTQVGDNSTYFCPRPEELPASPDTGCLRLSMKFEVRGEYQYLEKCSAYIEANGKPVKFLTGFSQDETSGWGDSTGFFSSFSEAARIKMGAGETEKVWSIIAGGSRWYYAPKYFRGEGYHPSMEPGSPEECGGERGSTTFLLDWSGRPK